MTKEIWRPVKNFPKYSVSNLGRIKRNNRFLTGSAHRHGHIQINLSVNNKRYYKQLHRLVAEAFIPNPSNLPIINHIDGNPANNAVSNLEWCTASYNTRHALYVLKKDIIKSGKENGQSKKIRCLETGKTWDCIIDAAKDLGLNKWTLYKRIQRGNKRFKIES